MFLQTASTTHSPNGQDNRAGRQASRAPLLTNMSIVDSIKGAIILRARLEEAGLPAPPPPPAAEEGALPLFHWIAVAPKPEKTKAALAGGFESCAGEDLNLHDRNGH